MFRIRFNSLYFCLFFVLFVSFIVIISASNNFVKDCTYSGPSGLNYDLNPLKKAKG